MIPGTYSVGFELPRGFTFSLPDSFSNDEDDSDVDPSTGRIGGIELKAGANQQSTDAGLIGNPDALPIGPELIDSRNRSSCRFYSSK